jgi:ribosomal protein L7/L12
MNKPLSADNRAQIHDLMQQGQKIEAIRLYREFTDVGLAEAKEAVERIEAEGPAVASATGAKLAAGSANPPDISVEKLAEIRTLLRQDQKIAAIRLYRECISCGLAEAKRAVEEMAPESTGRSPDVKTTTGVGSGCLGAAVVFCVVTVVIFKLIRL